MQNLGNKLSEVQTQVSGWVGNMRQSLQETVEFVSGALQREEDEDRGRTFERAISPLRSFASRGRQSLRNLSQQSRQRFSLRGRTIPSKSNSVQLKDCAEPEKEEQETDAVTMETDSPSEINDTVDVLGSENSVSQALQRLSSQTKRRNTSTDSISVQEEPETLLFPESSAPLLDSSVFRSKADLGKKRSIKRSRPSRAVRQRAALPALTEASNPDWRFCDSTDAQAQTCSNGPNSESEEESPNDATPTPAPSQPKRVPVFPGMDQSALMAQLKRRSGIVEADVISEVSAHSPRTPTKSLGPRVLPPVNGRDSETGSSPSWLLELKSKKRTTQPESNA